MNAQPPSLALCAFRDADARDRVAWASAAGFRAVQLDATHPQTRPRDLDRSARRDVAALLRRHEVACSGVDLWIPPEHFATREHIDRATAAVIDAISFARELAGLVRATPAACVALPTEPDADAMAAIRAAAERHDVRVADHAWPAPEAGDVGLDPAMAILAGADPVAVVASLGPRLAHARLSDAGTLGRAPLGSAGGRLDVDAYAAALAVSAPDAPLVLDTRMLVDPAEAALSGLAAWRASPATAG
ncbi:MAG: hypothetical protein AAFX79_07090 [Planctomycetota bacterium]